ncbi:MAG: OadG family protein [Clostridia bacterium]|nr:OadG family protein [Clostridia bacterium]
MGNYLLKSIGAEDPSILLVCALGIGVVFVGLAFLVGIVSIMNAFFNNTKKIPQTQSHPVPKLTPTSEAKSAPIENKQELIAAICAAVAEENGTDISAIRVLSFKKLN